MSYLPLRNALALTLLSTAAVGAASLGACAAGTGGNTFTTTATGGSGGATIITTSTASGGDVNIDTDAGTGGTGGSEPLTFLAYAHTGKTLYEFDPKQTSTPPKPIGDFDCYGDGAMTDLAVSKTGEIWGISATKAYQLQIQGGVVHCASPIQLGDGSDRFYGLTFAPEGVIKAEETLIAGNTAGELWAIDTKTGALQQHGTFGNVPNTDGNGHDYPSDSQVSNTVGKPWQLSGDIVFLANGQKPVGFATVRDCNSSKCSMTDTLIQIDMTKLKSVGGQSVTSSVRGQLVKRSGCGGTAEAYQQMLGIAAWNDKVYGFSHSGAVVEIDNGDGSACQLIGVSSLYWNGAGVTTVAPVIVPPQ